MIGQETSPLKYLTESTVPQFLKISALTELSQISVLRTVLVFGLLALPSFYHPFTLTTPSMRTPCSASREVRTKIGLCYLAALRALPRTTLR